LFKEELGLLMGRINLKDPGTLADFAASMTTASGKELQGKFLKQKNIKNTNRKKHCTCLDTKLESSKNFRVKNFSASRGPNVSAAARILPA
jgi:ATP dependent PIM1 peptidase. Serine peptidase. MEROPS family S16